MSRPPAATGVEVLVISVVTALLLAASWFKWLPLDFTEALGFATGAVCVWLVTKGNIWNWAVGLANNLFFSVLFWKARLFADFGLQGVYLILGIYGWYEWLRGGENRTRLAISRSSRSERIGIAVFLVVGTWGLRDAMPDALGHEIVLDTPPSKLERPEWDWRHPIESGKAEGQYQLDRLAEPHLSGTVIDAMQQQRPWES